MQKWNEEAKKWVPVEKNSDEAQTGGVFRTSEDSYLVGKPRPINRTITMQKWDDAAKQWVNEKGEKIITQEEMMQRVWGSEPHINTEGPSINTEEVKHRRFNVIDRAVEKARAEIEQETIMVRKSLDYHHIPRRPLVDDREPTPYLKEIDGLMPSHEREIDISAVVTQENAMQKLGEYARIMEEERPKMQKEREDDMKIKQMKEMVAESLRRALSGFVGVPNSAEVQEKIVEQISNSYQQILGFAANCMPLKSASPGFLEELAEKRSGQYQTDQELRKIAGTAPQHFQQVWAETGTTTQVQQDSILPPLREKLEYIGWGEAFLDSLKTNDSLQTKEETAVDTTHRGWIQTFTGRQFFPLNPKPEDICIRDIAHSLANICRFTGHVSEHYSVAQHSVLVSYLCGAEFALHGLLHDGSEFALTDIPRPLKILPLFAEYRKAEAVLQEMIYRKFGLSPEEPAEVKEADTRILANEARDFMAPMHPAWTNLREPYPFQILPLSPKEAEALFLHRLGELVSAEQFNRYMAE